MSIILQNVRYHTIDSVYHYTEDNKPLQDLAARDEALKAAIEDMGESNLKVIGTGNWASSQVTLDLSADLVKPFAYRIRTWAIQDQSIIASQVATINEDIIFGYNALPGTVNVLNTWNNFNHKNGVPTLSITYTPAGNNLILSFSGYTGTNGYVMVKAERFGV